MMNLIQGTLEIILLDVQQVKIHDTLYYQITYRSTDEFSAPQQLRINPEAFYPNPQTGDRVAVNVLMGNIMGAVKLDG